MVRRPYMTRLALGRSAFEPPEHVDQPTEELEALARESGSHVQRYDERGYPVNRESRTLARRLRRAQNDVLATVGVCVDKDREAFSSVRRHSTGGREKVERVVFENEVGLGVAAADLGLMFVCLWWTTAFRSRLQTFSFYEGVPLWDILKLEHKHWGLWKFMFAGMPAWAASFLINVARNYLLEDTIEYIWTKLLPLARSKGARRSLRSSRRWVASGCNYALYTLALPLQIFSYLQLLDLIPAMAVPSAQSFIPFSNESPIRLPSLPTSFAPHSMFQWGVSALLSPAVLICCTLRWKEIVEPRVYYYLRNRVPMPDNPDLLSFEASQEDDLDTGAIPGIGWTRESHQVEELSIVKNITKGFHDISDWVLSIVGPRRQRELFVPDAGIQALDTVESPGAVQASSESNRDTSPPPQDRLASRSSTATPVPEELFNLEEVFSNAGPRRASSPPLGMRYRPIPELADAPPSSTRYPRRRASTITSVGTFSTSRPITPPDSPLPAHSVRVSAHQTSFDDDSVTMQLEVSAPLRSFINTANNNSPRATAASSSTSHQESDNAPMTTTTTTATDPQPSTSPNSNSFSSTAIATPLSEINLPELAARIAGNSFTLPAVELPNAETKTQPLVSPHHRVTALSNHPPDSLASHTAALIANLIFLPLESLLLRSLAISYLSSPLVSTGVVAATAVGLRSQIYSPWTWFGGRGGAADYACKMGLAMGLQAQVSAVLWGGGMAFAMWAGRKWFRWGKL